MLIQWNTSPLLVLTVSALLGAWLPRPLQAQHAGVGGVGITGSAIATGPAAAMRAGQLTAIGGVVAGTLDALASGTLRSPATGRVFSERAQGLVEDVMLRETRREELQEALAVGYGDPDATAIFNLVETLEGLLSGDTYRGQVGQSWDFWNRFVSGAPDAYLANPPEEFMLIHSILVNMAAAAVEG